jgi:hypothetical protein
LLTESRSQPFLFVVVVGPSKAGKSRTALEAARSTLNDHPVIVPRHGQALAALIQLNPPPWKGVAPALVWLDDITVADLDHLTSDVLDELETGAVVLATKREQAWDEIYFAGSDITTASRSALRRAIKLELQFELTDVERIQARSCTRIRSKHLARQRLRRVSPKR